MKNLFVGIDISKEKLNLCYQKDLKTVLEEEVANDVKAIKKALLHMSAVNVATRMKEGEYKDYYERKLKEGKHIMCILNVIRAKLAWTIPSRDRGRRSQRRKDAKRIK